MRRLLCAAALALSLAATAFGADEKIKVLLIDGQNNHDWRSTTPVMKQALEASGRFTVDVLTIEPKKVVSENVEKLPDGNTKVTIVEIRGRVTTPATFK